MGLQHSTGKDGQLKPGSSHIQSSRMDEEDSLLQKGIISPGCESLTDVGTELHRVEVRERLYPRGHGATLRAAGTAPRATALP